MRKKCEKCGKEFEAQQPHFKLCPNCFSSSRRIDISALLLKSYYDRQGEPLKDVYIDIPQQLANIFASSKPSLGTKQLRDFHRRILKSRTKANLRGINSVKYILYECQRDIEYQLKRRVIPRSFALFMKHHLALAEADEKALEGFYQHLDSIVCYFPVKERNRGG